jgi:hypothetical protein
VSERGFFITVEGGEGAGKSTAMAFLERALSDADVDLVCTREPGGTELGERLREVLLTPGSMAIDPMAELLMIFAARAQHLHERVIPALQRGSGCSVIDSPMHRSPTRARDAASAQPPSQCWKTWYRVNSDRISRSFSTRRSRLDLSAPGGAARWTVSSRKIWRFSSVCAQPISRVRRAAAGATGLLTLQQSLHVGTARTRGACR